MMDPVIRESFVMALLYIGLPLIFFIGVYIGKTVTEWWIKKG